MNKLQRKRIAVALAGAFGAGAVLVVPAPAAAQDVRVTVTGSNIPRLENEGALPVQIITRADIEREGIQTAMGVVERLSANSSIGGLNLSGGIGATDVGYAAASLRGLGAPRTLVLLNGRRLANTAFSGTTVDINSIPLSAIERVEVLTDGASAIYGTDAIAGVINFILRQNYSGIEASAYYGDSEQGGGSVQRYNVTGGWGDLTKDKFNVFASVDYNKIDAIAANQRPFSKTSWIPDAPGGRFDKTSGNAFPANIFWSEGGGSPANPACIPPYSFPTSGNGQCRFDYASVIDIVPPSDSWNVYGSGRWQFAPDHQAFVEAAWSRTEATQKISPNAASSAFTLNGESALLPPTSPYYPHAFAAQFGADGQPGELFYRMLELGPRTDNYKTEQTRVVGGLKGLLAGWDYAVDVNWSQSEGTDNWSAGWALQSVIFPIIGSGVINPFGFNTPEALALLKTGLVTGKVLEAKGTMTDVNAKVSKDIYNLPAGPLALAAGIEWRREDYQYTSSAATASGDVLGLGGSIQSIPEQSRDVFAFYGEVNIPIVKNLDLDVALRYDDYQDTTDGRTWNPKVALRWQPAKQVLLRGSYGTGFRAPALKELYQNNFGATGDVYDDPLRCPTTGSPRDCSAQFTTKLGGNPDLKPETSTNWTAGVVFEPASSLTLGVEYWWIKVDNIIGIPAETPIFSDMIAAEAAGTLVRFAPGTPGCTPAQTAGGLPCPVSYGIQDLVNISSITTSGLDFNINARTPAQSWGQLNFNFQGTYYIQWDQQDPGGEKLHLAGSYGGGIAATVVGSGSTGAFPRWKHNANLGWSFGPWQANVNQTYVHSYSEPCNILSGGAAAGPCTTGPTRTVGSYGIWGLNGSFTGLKNWTFTVGVKNLLDTDPPYTRQANSFQIGYDPALTDPTGRFWWGSIKFAFK
jgi:iron complex outermembrane receptor protein